MDEISMDDEGCRQIGRAVKPLKNWQIYLLTQFVIDTIWQRFQIKMVYNRVL